jgi:hypothetical protein
MTLSIYSPCVFFIKVFMSSLRSVDIIPLRGTGGNRSEPERTGANRSEPELGAANCSQLSHVFIAQAMPVRSIKEYLLRGAATHRPASKKELDEVEIRLHQRVKKISNVHGSAFSL